MSNINYKVVSGLVIVTLVCALALSLISGCGCPFIQGTAYYQPISDWEQSEFDKADFSVYPDDVREDITRYQNTTLAWTGIIVEGELNEYDTHFEWVYLLEHHYYDWLEDISPPYHEKIWLSPRGEGFFKTSWDLNKEGTLAEIQEMGEPGILLIVYGKAISIEDDIIIVEASYIRGIWERNYTMEKLDYGRTD